MTLLFFAVHFVFRLEGEDAFHVCTSRVSMARGLSNAEIAAGLFVAETHAATF